ncbi:MAG: type II toxin-antitoxin system HicB family antitoxin [Deltaproteobacteria bacterium]|nr:type II toxin-antitoxin system HicB family antitoxin [Deltaproteobacteria bacterium]
MTFTVEYEQEEDGRWIAEVLELPGVMVYGATRQEALAKAKALALRVVAEVRDELQS